MYKKIGGSPPKKFDERKLPQGLFYRKEFLSISEKQEVLDYLKTLYPIWEQRYSNHNPPPPGKQQRMLLRPVYWLGNWQFACLNYYHPPKGTQNRSVFVEGYPPILKKNRGEGRKNCTANLLSERYSSRLGAQYLSD